MPTRGRLLLAAVIIAAAILPVGAVEGWRLIHDKMGQVVPKWELCTAEAALDGQTFDASLGVEEAENAAIITGVAIQRGMPARAATIALATAIQESKLRNLDYGDLDSVGLSSSSGHWPSWSSAWSRCGWSSRWCRCDWSAAARCWPR